MKTTQEVISYFNKLTSPGCDLSDKGLLKLITCSHPAARCFDVSTLNTIRYRLFVTKVLQSPLPPEEVEDAIFIEEGARIFLAMKNNKDLEQDTVVKWLNMSCHLSTLIKLFAVSMGDTPPFLVKTIDLSSEKAIKFVAKILNACHKYTLPSKN